MPTYLYCLLSSADPSCPPADLVGLEGAPVRRLAVADDASARDVLYAWVSTTATGARGSRADEAARNALVHHTIVQAALDAGHSPLPARFGQSFEDDASCQAQLATRLPALNDALTRLRGMVQMRVVVSRARRGTEMALDDPLPNRSAPEPGRRYLEALRQRSHRLDSEARSVEEQLDLVDSAVGAITREKHRHVVVRPPAVVYGAATHLVHRSGVGEYRDALAGVMLSPEWRLASAGPEPPYSFSAILPPSIRHESGSPTLPTP